MEQGPINGAIKQTVTSVGTTATALPATTLAGRRTMLVHNDGAVIVYLGDSTVTADDTAATGGYELAAGAEKAFDIGKSVVLYGRTASGTANVKTFEGA